MHRCVFPFSAIVGQKSLKQSLLLNATEDRVAGGIDFSLAVRQGRRALQPG